MKIFIDTNVWLRFLLADVESQYQECLALFSKIEEGKFKLYTSTIVLLEINYVLTSLLKIKKSEISKDIEAILQTRNLTLIEKTDFQKALKIYQKTNIKLADCLIASQLPIQTILCTFDQEFRKIKNLEVAAPYELLQKASEKPTSGKPKNQPPEFDILSDQS